MPADRVAEVGLALKRCADAPASGNAPAALQQCLNYADNFRLQRNAERTALENLTGRFERLQRTAFDTETRLNAAWSVGEVTLFTIGGISAGIGVGLLLGVFL